MFIGRCSRAGQAPAVSAQPAHVDSNFDCLITDPVRLIDEVHVTGNG